MFWIQREYNKTDYFNNIIKDIIAEDKERIFEINVFISGAQQKNDVRLVLISYIRSLFLADGIELSKKDSKGKFLNDLCSGNTYWGRPEWEDIFKRKAVKFRKGSEVESKIGVFVCGNNTLVEDIYEQCENFNSAAVKFELNVEHF